MTWTLHGNYCEYNYLGNAGANCRCHWDNAAMFVNVNKVWKSCWRSFWLDPCPLPFPPLSSRHSTFGRSKGTMSYNQFNKTVYISHIKKIIFLDGFIVYMLLNLVPAWLFDFPHSVTNFQWQQWQLSVQNDPNEQLNVAILKGILHPAKNPRNRYNGTSLEASWTSHRNN